MELAEAYCLRTHRDVCVGVTAFDKSALLVSQSTNLGGGTLCPGGWGPKLTSANRVDSTFTRDGYVKPFHTS